MKNILRIVAFLLALLMLASVFVACKPQDPDDTDDTTVEVEEVTLYNKGRCTQTEIEVKLVSEELCSCGKSNGRSVNSVCIYCLLIGYIEVNLGNVICCELDVIVEYDTGNYSVKKSVLGLDVGPLCLIVVNNCKLPSLVYIVSVDNVCLKYNGVEG